MANSYNELFGLGSWSPDSALLDHLKQQDDAASTTVVNRISDRNGTLVGAGNTSDSTVTGPTSWLPKALSYDGTNDTTSTPAVTGTTYTEGTIITWLRNKFATAASRRVAVSTSTNATTFSLYGTSHASQERLAYNWSNATNQFTWAGGPLITNDEWTHCAVTVNSSEARIYKNGSLGGTNTVSHPSTTYAATRRIASANASYLNCHQAGTAIFSRELAASEIAESYAGPEPLNTVAPVLTDFSCSTGTWDSQNNGPITYSYQWYSYTNTSGGGETLLSGETNSTITPGVGLDGLYLRCKVRGSNSGGYDAAEDTFSDYSSQVSSGGSSETFTSGTEVDAGVSFTVSTGDTLDIAVEVDQPGSISVSTGDSLESGIEIDSGISFSVSTGDSFDTAIEHDLGGTISSQGSIGFETGVEHDVAGSFSTENSAEFTAAIEHDLGGMFSSQGTTQFTTGVERDIAGSITVSSGSVVNATFQSIRANKTRMIRVCKLRSLRANKSRNLEGVK